MAEHQGIIDLAPSRVEGFPRTQAISGLYYPEDFGARGDGADPAFDDAPGIQAALDAAAVNLGAVWLRPGATYNALSPIEVDPTRMTMLGNSCTIDASNRTFVDPAAVPDIAIDGGFTDNPTSWTIAGTTTNAGFAIGAGQAGTAAGTNAYSEFGIQLPFVAGQRYTIEITGTITQVGEQGYLGVALREGSVQAGPTRSRNVLGANDANNGGTMTVELLSTSGNEYLRFDSNNDFTITGVTVRQVPQNYVVLVRTGSTGTQYGHASRGFERIRFVGPGRDSFSECIRFSTIIESFSSRMNMPYLDIERFDTGIMFADRTYLVHMYGSQIQGCGVCIATAPGSPDAGENLSFYGGTIGNSLVAVRNDGGFSLRFFTTSFDYVRQFYIGGGLATFNDCWFETAQHTAADAARPDFAETQYRFDLGGATLHFIGGLMQFSRGFPQDNNLSEALFRTTARSSVNIKDMAAWNWRSSTDVLAIGDGLVQVDHVIGNSPKQVATKIRDSIDANALGRGGGMQQSTIEVPCWMRSLSAPLKSRYVDEVRQIRHRVGDITAGSNVITNIDTTGIIGGFEIYDDRFPHGTALLSVDSATQITVTQNANATAAGSTIGIRSQSTGLAGFEMSTAQARTGTQSLRLYKTGVGTGTAIVGEIGFPINKNRRVSGELHYMIPAGGTGSFQLFATFYFAKIVGAEHPDLVPVVYDRLFAGENNPTIDLAVGVPWTRLQLSTMNFDNTSTSNGFAPEWATHFLVTYNLVNAPDGFEMFFDDLFMNSY